MTKYLQNLPNCDRHLYQCTGECECAFNCETGTAHNCMTTGEAYWRYVEQHGQYCKEPWSQFWTMYSFGVTCDRCGADMSTEPVALWRSNPEVLAELKEIGVDEDGAQTLELCAACANELYSEHLKKENISSVASTVI